jgi:hypothetical protein
MEKIMFRARTCILTIVAVFYLGAGAALAQSQTPPAPTPATPPSTSATAAATMQDVSKWTRKQWNAAKAKWVEEKGKWDGCQKQATAQKLSGKKSWQFLYDCMTKS